MGLKQKIELEALQIRNPVGISANKTLTLADMEDGTVSCTKTGAGQTITLPDLAGPPFLIVAAGGQTVTVSALYDGALTNAIVTKLSGLCHYVNGLGWFCISAVPSS